MKSLSLLKKFPIVLNAGPLSSDSGLVVKFKIFRKVSLSNSSNKFLRFVSLVSDINEIICKA